MERIPEHGQATAADSLTTSKGATACYVKDSSLRNKYLVGCLLKDEGVRNDGDFFSQRTMDGLFGRVLVPTWSIDIALLQVHNNSNVDRYPVL